MNTSLLCFVELCLKHSSHGCCGDYFLCIGLEDEAAVGWVFTADLLDGDSVTGDIRGTSLRFLRDWSDDAPPKRGSDGIGVVVSPGTTSFGLIALGESCLQFCEGEAILLQTLF